MASNGAVGHESILSKISYRISGLFNHFQDYHKHSGDKSIISFDSIFCKSSYDKHLQDRQFT